MIRPSLGFGTTAFSLTEIKSPPAGGRFDLFLNLGQVEGACRLARRIILHGSEELSRQLLDGDENEHSLQEPIVVGVRVVLRFLERIAAQIEQQRHPQLNEWLAPPADWFIIFSRISGGVAKGLFRSAF